MSDPEQDRLASALGRILRSDAVDADDEGFVPLEVARARLSRELGEEIAAERVRQVVARSRRLEVDGDRLRAARRPGAPPPPPPVPDILYHACTAEQVQRYLEQGAVRPPNGRPVFLSDDECQAWRVAHRMGGEPRVLYVDTARHRRRRLRVQRSRRTGLYSVRSLSLSDVLNLQPDFAEQLSAGGIPMVREPDGTVKMALIKVTRRSGVTWEVAKGKLEPGEPPEWAGVREVQEEMGIDVDFDVKCLVGLVRYGFLAPGGLPRLKTIYLYLLEPKGDMGGRFNPSAREGIGDVRWFSAEEACRVVTHTSLRPLMRRARQLAEGR